MTELENRIRRGWRIAIRRRNHGGLIAELFDETDEIACVTYPDSLGGIISEMEEAFGRCTNAKKFPAKPPGPCTRHESDGTTTSLGQAGTFELSEYTTCKHCGVLFRRT